MRRVRILLFAAAGVLAAQPLPAQSRGTWELGAFGRWSRYTDTLGRLPLLHLPAENGFGGGLRLGYFLIKNLELEADLSYGKVDAAGGGKVRHLPLHAGLTYNFPLKGKLAFLLGARFVNNWYGEDADFTDQGFGAVGGFRLGPLRVEATWDRMPEDEPSLGAYSNVGVNAGLSLLLGACNKSKDGVTISPTSTTLEPRQRATFTAEAYRCGKLTGVAWTATGGEVTQAGEYTAGPTDGTFQVTATEPKSGSSSSATVVIKSPPPPPPPPPAITLTRIDLTPDNARVKMNEQVSFTVTGIYSSGPNRPLTNCTLTGTGNPTQSGNQFSWARPGNYTVSAQCEGMSDQSTVEVALEVIIYSTNFEFDRDRLTASGMDTVRMAAEEFKKYPELKIRLGGHADFMGTDAYNCNLSWRRARTVQRALNGFGIGNDRITLVEGFGEAYPIPDDQVPAAWKEINERTRDKGKWWDRRVVITSATPDPGMTSCKEP